MCRGCLRAIRLEDDGSWVLTPEQARPRAVQLILGLFLGQSGAARALRRPLTSPVALSAWQRALRTDDAEADGGEVLAPAVLGQTALFPAARTLTQATTGAVACRAPAGEELALAQIHAFAEDHGLKEAWKRKAARMARLALVLRDAEGALRVPDYVLADLPEIGTAVGLILERAGLLDGNPTRAATNCGTPPHAAYIPPPRTPSWPAPRSCRECDGWMSGIREYLCRSCSTWKGEPRGRCAGCAREQTPLRQGRCRLCSADPTAAAAGHQLTIVVRAAARGRSVPAREATKPLPHPEGAAASIVPYGQQVLFRVRRDWAPVMALVRDRKPLPDLSERAAALVEEFDLLRRRRRRPGSGREGQRALVLLLRFLGADAPIWEYDVHDLCRAGTGLYATAVCDFLKARGLLTEAPALHRDRDEKWVGATLDDLPTQLAAEVATWVKVLRGQGRRPHPARGFRCIRRYLSALQPALVTWAQAGVVSLREITHEDVVCAARARNGNAGSQLASALRSLFRALKQERAVFHDPTRALTGPRHTSLPRSVPSDLLPVLFGQVTSPFGRLVVALVAVHALTGENIRSLLLVDLDLAHGRATIRRALNRRTIHLDPFTHQLAADWLAERHRRWPASTNPYLLTTGRTAFAASAPPVDVRTVRGVFPKGMSLDVVRQDRILDEARTSTDPLHLMRLFGISDATAMRYVAAAHPERTGKLPR
ncbi:hypothetical protein [Streptomyces sp. CB00455]|uniref:hypothetical protein n=1 Tax=Streptomyces sp. CB00455 TaxID=1703927 RepID=UPI0009A0D694|nr:hypothetical protein [Streptomyces sp. CB00455]